MNEIGDIVKRQLDAAKNDISNHIAVTYALLLSETDKPNYTAMLKVPYGKRKYLQATGARTENVIQRDFFTTHEWLTAQIGDTLDTAAVSLQIKSTGSLPEYISEYNQYLTDTMNRTCSQMSESARMGFLQKLRFEDLRSQLFKVFDTETKKLPEAAGDAYALMENEDTLDILAEAGMTKFTIEVSDGACEECESHAGRLYTAEEIRDNMPPFHPNCRCKVVSAGSEAIHNQYSNETQRKTSAAKKVNTIAVKQTSSSDSKAAAVVTSFASALSGKEISQPAVYGPQPWEKGFRMKFTIPGLQANPSSKQYFIPTSVEDAINFLDAYYAGDEQMMSRYDPVKDVENAFNYLAGEGLSYTIKGLRTDYIVTIASGILAVRDKPGGVQISSLSPNQKIKIVMPKETKKENDRLWIKVYYDGNKTGWVAEEFVKEFMSSTEKQGNVAYRDSTMNLIKQLEGTAFLTPRLNNDGSITIGYGYDFTEKSDPDMFNKYLEWKDGKIAVKATMTEENAALTIILAANKKGITRALDSFINGTGYGNTTKPLSINQNQYDALFSYFYANGGSVFTDSKYDEWMGYGGEHALRAQARKELRDYVIANNGNYDAKTLETLFVNSKGANLNYSYKERRRTEANLFGK